MKTILYIIWAINFFLVGAWCGYDFQLAETRDNLRDIRRMADRIPTVIYPSYCATLPVSAAFSLSNRQQPILNRRDIKKARLSSYSNAYSRKRLS